MTWCERMVKDWWRGHMMSGSAKEFFQNDSAFIPMYIRVCLSWITHADAREWRPRAVYWKLARMFGSLSEEREDYIALGKLASLKADMQKFEAASSMPRDPVAAVLRAEVSEVSSF